MVLVCAGCQRPQPPCAGWEQPVVAVHEVGSSARSAIIVVAVIGPVFRLAHAGTWLFEFSTPYFYKSMSNFLKLYLLVLYMHFLFYVLWADEEK